MVELSKFKGWMVDLGTNFGLRGDPLEGKSELYYREFQNVNAAIFDKAARLILEGDERFPTIARMKEALIEAGRTIDITAPVIPCQVCGGSGFVETVKNCGILSSAQTSEKISWGDFTFRCKCGNGAYRNQKILIWDDKWRAKGHMLKIEFDEWWSKNEAGKHINPLDRGLIGGLKTIGRRLKVELPGKALETKLPGEAFLADMEKIKQVSIEEWDRTELKGE